MDTKEKELETAVLFVTYTRLDTTKRVFESIRKAKPKRLYISSNMGVGEEEKGRVSEVRLYLEENIDWECQVQKLYRTECLSVKDSISGAIDWFFSCEEMGIILEDDCLPSQSFFWFCEDLLNKYKSDMRVGQISGDNFQKGIKRGDGDYYFSTYNHIWGWASWANRWENYDASLNSFENTKFIGEIFDKKSTLDYWSNIFKRVKKGNINTWDYQWTFSLWRKQQLTVLPNTNLIENIGFGSEAVHTTEKTEFSNLQAFEIESINHPKCVERNLEADEFTTEHMFKNQLFITRVISKVGRLLKASKLYAIKKLNW